MTAKIKLIIAVTVLAILAIIEAGEEEKEDLTVTSDS